MKPAFTCALAVLAYSSLTACPLIQRYESAKYPQWTPQCETRCKLKLIGAPAPAWWSCTDFQKAEDRTLALWSRYIDTSQPAGMFAADPAKVCYALGHSAVWLVRGESFVSFGTVRAGEAICDTGVARIATSTRISSAFVYELSHLLQDCRGGETHEGWAAAGLQAVLDHWDDAATVAP